VPVGQVPVTSTVGQVAQTPGGIGYNTAVVVGRVVKLNGRDSFDVVNANGGGIYTIKTTNPTREAAVALLKVGDSITASVSRSSPAQVRPIRQGPVWLLIGVSIERPPVRRAPSA
jgi:hypothetical protein